MSPEDTQSDDGEPDGLRPDPSSIYGEEVPAHEELEEEPPYEKPDGGLPLPEEVEEEMYRDRPVPAPTAEEPEPEEPVTEEPEETGEDEKDEETVVPSEPLHSALQGKELVDIVQQLSPEERELLQLRFDLTTGKRVFSKEEAAKELGLGLTEFNRREQELLDQISYLASLDSPDTNNLS